MIPFPIDFPVDAAKLVVDHAAGVNDVSCDEACLACWNLCGYVEGLLLAEHLPCPTPGPVFLRAVTLCSDAELAAHLNACIQQATGTPRRWATSAVPWKSILATLLALLQKLAS